MAKQYNAGGQVGCVITQKSRHNGSMISIYNNEQAIGRWWSLDDAPGPWATVCETHTTVAGHQSLTLARDFATTPGDWCKDCNGQG